MTINKEWRLASQFGEEKKIINSIKQIISVSDAYRNRTEDIMSAVAEACLNAFEHGNKMKADLQVRVQMKSQDNGLCFRIYDEGNGFEYTNTIAEHRTVSLSSLSDINNRGWGIFIIFNLADSITVGYEKNKFFLEILFLK